MDSRAIIRNIFLTLLWTGIGGGMFILLLAAMDKKDKEQCSRYTISIQTGLENISMACNKTNSSSCAFIDEKDIQVLIQAALGGDPQGKKIADINLRELENLLESKEWIQDAEMWFDNQNVLRIAVKERIPVARIFTQTGQSFYFDSTGYRMPVSDKMTVQVPVFTGFPDTKIRATKKDSLLVQDVNKMALYILRDSFWMSQVAQVEITSEGNFEIVPVVGNHLVKFGNADDLQKKFNRLKIFYKEVVSRTGFDRYGTVDVQYQGQVVATQRGSEKKNVDYAKLRNNIENLIRQVQDMQKDTTVFSPPVNVNPATVENKEEKSKPEDTNAPTGKQEKKPKAVMPKKAIS